MKLIESVKSFKIKGGKRSGVGEPSNSLWSVMVGAFSGAALTNRQQLQTSEVDETERGGTKHWSSTIQIVELCC